MLDVKLVGQVVSVSMNGKSIIDNGRISGPTSKTPEVNIPEGQPGPILLQRLSGGTCTFRNIRIRELD